MLQILTQQPSLVNDYLAELRNITVQHDRARFRKNIQRIGQLMAYEISKDLPRVEEKIHTPLGVNASHIVKDQPVLATVLRAGLPMHQGFLDFFDHADNAYVSAYRKHLDNHEFEIVVEYLATPSLEGRTLILIDPMLATGRSMFLTYKALLTKGTPKQVFVASVIASEQGIAYIQQHMPHAKIIVGAVDKELNSDSYIVPGLGDAGDLAFGEKL